MMQFLIAAFGVVALWLAYSSSPTSRRLSPYVGICGQPWWLMETWQAAQFGMFALSVAFTAVYISTILGDILLRWINTHPRARSAWFAE